MAKIVTIEGIVAAMRNDTVMSADFERAEDSIDAKAKRRKIFENRVDVGESLEAKKRESEHEGITWEKWCKDNLPSSKQQADKFRRFYHAREFIREVIHYNLPGNIDRAVALIPTQADSKRLGFSRDKVKRDSDNWQTPQEYLDAARRVMSGIDFDPYSSSEANGRVQAKEFYAKEDDADTTPWPMDRVKTVWMNPPYGRGAVQRAVDAFIRHLPRIEQAIVLVNNTTDTAWAHQLMETYTAKVATRGRISFEVPREGTDKVQSSNTRGQDFYYFGDNLRGFVREFSKYGHCSVPCEVCNEE